MAKKRRIQKPLWTKTPVQTEQRVNREIELARKEVKKMQDELKDLHRR